MGYDGNLPPQIPQEKPLNEDTRIALLFTPIWFVILWAFYSMLNTDDEDALSEELIEMAGVKEIYKKPKKDDSDDYII